jgi:hypothetical protein
MYLIYCIEYFETDTSSSYELTIVVMVISIISLCLPTSYLYKYMRKVLYMYSSPVNRDIKMAPPCKKYRKVYTWQVSSIRHIINIAEFATLGGCRSPHHTGE